MKHTLEERKEDLNSSWDARAEEQTHQDRDPGAVESLLKEAQLAVEAGRTGEAFRMYQKALVIRPFHPRTAKAAKRYLPAHRWERLRFLEKVPPFWSEPGELIRFPLQPSLPVFLATALPLCLSILLGSGPIVPLGLSLALAMHAAWNRYHLRPALAWGWGGVCSKERIAAVAAGVGAMVEASLPVILWGGLEGGGAARALSSLADSPEMQVVLSIVLVAYLPGAFAVALAGGKDALDPSKALKLMATAEAEYAISCAFAAGLLGLLGLSAPAILSLPLLGPVLLGTVLAYASLTAGFVAGTLANRYRHVVPSQLAAAKSSSEVNKASS